MSKGNHTTTDTKAHESSALERLNLSFEYNITWADEKRLIKERTV